MESVADADDQFAVGNEFLEVVAQMVTNTGCENGTRTKVVAKGEATNEGEDMIVVQFCGVFCKIVQVKLVGLRSTYFERGGGFDFTVQSKTCNH